MLRCWSALTTVPCLGAAQVVAGVPDGRSVWWRLITCGGGFDRSTGHYRDNLIVYASLAG